MLIILINILYIINSLKYNLQEKTLTANVMLTGGKKNHILKLGLNMFNYISQFERTL